MKTKSCLLFLLLSCLGLSQADPLGTAFTYQGELKQLGALANGQFDFRFEIFDLDRDGITIASPVLLEDIVVADGVFTVELDFGAMPFAGDQLWLEIGVRDSRSIGNHTVLVPRQKMTAAPFALHAEYVAMGSVGSAEIDSNQVQERVSAFCNSGSAIRVIGSNGTVSCQDAGGPLTFGHYSLPTTVLDGTQKTVYTASSNYTSMSNGTCFVSCSARTYKGGQTISSGYAQMRVAYSTTGSGGTSTTNQTVEFGLGSDGTNSRAGASTSSTVQIFARANYWFGCYLTAQGDYIGKDAYAGVTFICQ